MAPLFLTFVVQESIISNMSKILLSGASVTAGLGLPQERHTPELFVNRLATESLGYKSTDINNICIVGLDNHGIFLDTAAEITKNKYTDVIVCWQTIPTINFNFGLETYTTSTSLVAPHKMDATDINLVHNQVISKKKIYEMRMFLLRYYNLHWGILDLVRYINILQTLAQTNNTRLHFINFALPWDTNHYFKQIDWTAPSELDPATQDILNAEFRDDEETRLIYNKIHQAYSNVGGINEALWLNLYDPLKRLQVDNIDSDDRHPGMQSQGAFFDYLSPILKSR